MSLLYGTSASFQTEQHPSAEVKACRKSVCGGNQNPAVSTLAAHSKRAASLVEIVEHLVVLALW